MSDSQTLPAVDPDADERTLFEAWAKPRHYPLDRNGLGYVYTPTQSVWVAWKEGRAQLRHKAATPVRYEVRYAGTDGFDTNTWMAVHEDSYAAGGPRDRYPYGTWERRKLYTQPPAPPQRDDTRELQTHLRELILTGEYLYNRVLQTNGAQCMDDFDAALEKAKRALAQDQG